MLPSEFSESLSTTLADAVAAVARSVVRVDARGRHASTGTIIGEDLVVTAAHTIEREQDITVGLPDDEDPTQVRDGGPVAATLLGSDPHTDIALLQVAGARAVLPFAALDGLRLGALALAVGRPGRLRAAISILTVVDGPWRTPGGGRVDRWIETDLGGWPGFSGSPLLNTRGELLGINTAGLAPRRSLALPGETVLRIAASILSHGRVRRGWLGIGAQPVRLPAAAAAQAGRAWGLLVVSIAPDSPAERGGLLLGDTLLALDGAAIGRVEELVAALDADRIGESVHLRVLRAGEVCEISLTLGGR